LQTAVQEMRGVFQLAEVEVRIGKPALLSLEGDKKTS
jgi:hypothetical protein